MMGLSQEDTDMVILIAGASHTGKTALAQRLHQMTKLYGRLRP